MKDTGDFRIQVRPKKNELKLGHDSRVLSLGSCFADEIGQRLSRFKFQVNVNPFGIMFNPISIVDLISKVLSGIEYNETDLIKHNELYLSWDFHSRMGGLDLQAVLNNINRTARELSTFISSADTLILTFGTSWVYELRETGQIVANCHKVPQSTFLKRLLSVSQIVDEVSRVIGLLRKVRPELKVIFTVSPVRHWKDGAHENTLSKSILHLAVHELITRFSGSVYFPAYEILIDELRDYRFFASDMLHPSSDAVDFIWSLFGQAYFSEATLGVNKEIQQVLAAVNHKPFNPASKTHQDFICTVRDKIEVLENQLNCSFRDEKERLNRF